MMRDDSDFFGSHNNRLLQNQHHHGMEDMQNQYSQDGGDDDHAVANESHRQLVDGLVKLLTLSDSEENRTGSGMELLDSLVPRTVQLILASRLPLTDENFQRLLPLVLHLVVDNNGDDAAMISNTNSIARLEGALTLINEHLTPNRLGEVLEADEDIWIALIILLNTLRRHHDQYAPGPTSLSQSSFSSGGQGQELSFIETGLHVLAGKLLEFWKEKMDDSKTTVDAWLRQHFLSLHQQQQQADLASKQQLPQLESHSILSRREYARPEDLGQHVEECRRLVEHYGADLLEKALQVLEEGGQYHHSGSRDNNQHKCDQGDDGSEPATFCAMQYSTLATNWISLFGEEFTSLSNLTRSLWRALYTFIVERLEEGDTNHSSINEGSDEIQMGATDNLWKLTQIHYQYGHIQEQDVSIIVLTIYRMWRHSNYFWMPTTIEWVKTNLLNSKNCKYSTPIRRALQAGLLSMMYFSQTNNSEEAMVITSLTDLIKNPLQDDDDGEDPWHSLVLEEVENFSFQMEQQMRNP